MQSGETSLNWQNRPSSSGKERPMNVQTLENFPSKAAFCVMRGKGLVSHGPLASTASLSH
jgi:hypothetical protein